MWKKICTIFLMVCVLLLGTTFAATKEDVLSAVNRTYTIGDESFRLPQNIINKAENYLNTHPLSSDKYDTILGCINNVVELAKKNGTTDITKISREDIKEGLGYLAVASKTANVDLNKELAENNVKIPDGKDTSQSEKSQNNTNTVKKQSSQINDKSTVKQSEAEIENDGQDIETNQEDNFTGENLTNSEDLEEVLPLETFESIKKEDLSSKKSIKDIDKYIILAVIGIIFIIILFIFIFYLIFRSKWYKILKYMAMIILVMLILIALVILVMILTSIEEIRMLYEVYYLLK